MKLSGLWTRKSSPKESEPEPSPPSTASAPRWARLRSKLSNRRDDKTKDPTAPLDRSAATKKSTGERKRHLVSPKISLRPSVHPPRQRTPCSPSQDNVAVPTRTESSSSSRSTPHDSPPSQLLSECDNTSFAALKADTLGAICSAECHVPPVYIEANTGEVINAVVSESQHFPSIPSSDPVSFIDRSKKIPKRDLGFAGNPESFEALFQHQSDEKLVEPADPHLRSSSTTFQLY
ncbi:hypothetical protein M407DRAFT_30240 [Tulasnella calospora MUT 4182]|uniref:Uncharacterized protein n=1 Tax=Tulasnella calospora MUT 4182 TaxID=1051891 RepID=A0A0C3KF33_9AGAM|nr:hypothetical protein M407DRAFT_30240 [Tulasnella calospora MUT 4182]